MVCVVTEQLQQGVQTLDGSRNHGFTFVSLLFYRFCVIQIVGCDHELGSSVKEDNCGICSGDGSSCRLVRGHYKSQHATGKGKDSSLGYLLCFCFFNWKYNAAGFHHFYHLVHIKSVSISIIISIICLNGGFFANVTRAATNTHSCMDLFTRCGFLCLTPAEDTVVVIPFKSRHVRLVLKGPDHLCKSW